MTSLARWPARRPRQAECRHCGEPFVTTDGAKHCRREPCQDAKRRREHEAVRRPASLLDVNLLDPKWTEKYDEA